MIYRIIGIFLLLILTLLDHAQAQIKPELEYYINGRVKLETMYNKHGEKHGLEKLYYSTGELWSRTNYYRGRKDQVEKVYYKSGNIMKLKPYNKGMLEGIEKSYWENGNLMEEIPYADGVKEGTARYYNMDGSLFEEKVWENGVLKKTIPAQETEEFAP